MKLNSVCFSSLIVSLTLLASIDASYTLKDGKLVNTKIVPTMSVQEHYGAAMAALQKKDWDELVKHTIIVTKNFPDTPFADDSIYYLGLGYYHLKEYDMANEQFSDYLKKGETPKHFEEAIQYKFSIAEKFKEGEKRHLMGWQKMPKWSPAVDEALGIYDEVITALPHHDLSAQALYGKGRLFLKDEDYRASIDSFQTVIMRFPKHPLAPKSYIGIGEVYLAQCQNEYPDPDFLDLAEINLRKFRYDFPGEERVAVTENMLLQMKEIYAANLYETGQFYERTKKPGAAMIYYNKVISKYPETKLAESSRKRLVVLEKSDKKKGKEKVAKAEKPDDGSRVD